MGVVGKSMNVEGTQSGKWWSGTSGKEETLQIVRTAGETNPYITCQGSRGRTGARKKIEKKEEAKGAGKNSGSRLNWGADHPQEATKRGMVEKHGGDFQAESADSKSMGVVPS